MMLAQQDTIHSAAQTGLQTLLRVGFRKIPGQKSDVRNLASEKLAWDGMIVTPSGKASKKPPGKSERKQRIQKYELQERKGKAGNLRCGFPVLLNKKTRA